MNCMKKITFAFSNKINTSFSLLKGAIYLFLIFNFSLFTFHSFSQGVAINATGSVNANASAMLDIASTTKGVLIPRMSDVNRNAIPSPATGLLIYNTTTNKLNYYKNTGWYELSRTFQSSVTGTNNSGGGMAINETGAPANNSAILDVNSTKRGLLIPRTTESFLTPIAGLIYYDNSLNSLRYYNGTSWKNVCETFITTITGTGSLTTLGVAINITGDKPDSSAILDIKSGNKGLLMPRMTTTEREQILPVIGLIIYNTTTNTIDYYNGAEWSKLETATPVQPSAITGSISVCQGTTGLIYSVTNVPGVTYTWTVPTDWIITAQGANSITVTAGSASGNIVVTPSNACGNGTTQTLAVIPFLCGPSCGTQVWASANLNVGTMITSDASHTGQQMTAPGGDQKYCYNNLESNCTTFGGLYEWGEALNYAASVNCDPCGPTTGHGGVQGICPSGYHIPSDLEWSRYEYCIESTIVPTGSTPLTGAPNDGNFSTTISWRGTNDPNIGPGAKMKTSTWNGNNASGFGALAGGDRFGIDGSFANNASTPSPITCFWTATDAGIGSYYRRLYSFSYQSDRSSTNYPENYGFSVRCLKD